jgi:hypothetical protein
MPSLIYAQFSSYRRAMVDAVGGFKTHRLWRSIHSLGGFTSTALSGMHNVQAGFKKRPAKTQGPKDTKKRKTTPAQDSVRPGKKRNRPITSLDNAKSSSDEEQEEQEDEYEKQEDAMDIDDTPKLNASKNSASLHLWLPLKKLN